VVLAVVVCFITLMQRLISPLRVQQERLAKEMPVVPPVTMQWLVEAVLAAQAQQLCGALEPDVVVALVARLASQAVPLRMPQAVV
jgi:hypothetical protein